MGDEATIEKLLGIVLGCGRNVQMSKGSSAAAVDLKGAGRGGGGDCCSSMCIFKCADLI